MRADRLLDLVALLRRHERLSAAELASRLGVSRRTVLRDVDALSASGVPVYAQHGRAGGFSMLPGYRPETAGLTDAESAALFLPGGEPAAEAVGRGAEFRSARRKLEAILSTDAARAVGDLDQWLLIAPEGWGQPPTTPALVPELATAASRRQVIDIDYQARGEPPRRRRVRPIGLVLAGRTWYVLARKDGTGEQRTYRIDRVQSVSGTGHEFEPGGPTVAQAWEQARTDMRASKVVEVVLRTSRDALPVITFVVSTIGRVLSVETLTDGRREVAGAFDRLPAAAAMLAGLGERAQIVSPPELIEEILEVSRHNLARYGRPSGPSAPAAP